MKKTLLSITMVMVLCIMVSLCVSAASGIEVLINGNSVTFDVPPQIINNRTMVPMRAIFEELGATVTWDAATQTVTGTTTEKTVQLTINSTLITINGTAQTMDVAPLLIDNRTLVPVRFIAEAFDCEVEWDQVNQVVDISTEKFLDYYTDGYEPFPTYASATNEIFINYDAIFNIYTYSYTSYNDYADYINLLKAEGWVVSETITYDGNYTHVFTKGLAEIGVTASTSQSLVFIEYEIAADGENLGYDDEYYEDESTEYNAKTPFVKYDVYTGSPYDGSTTSEGFSVAMYSMSGEKDFFEYIHYLESCGWVIDSSTNSEDYSSYLVIMHYGSDTQDIMKATLSFDYESEVFDGRVNIYYK